MLRGELVAGMAGRLRNCTVELEGLSAGHYRSCGAVYAGGLNSDGKEDLVLDLRGESGCGGATLFLLTPAGWKKAAENSDDC